MTVLTDLLPNWTFHYKRKEFLKIWSYKLIQTFLKTILKKPMPTLSLNDSLACKNLRWICLVANFQSKNPLTTQPKTLLSQVLGSWGAVVKLTISINTNTDSKFVHQVCRANSLQLKPRINVWTPLLLMTMQGEEHQKNASILGPHTSSPRMWK